MGARSPASTDGTAVGPVGLSLTSLLTEHLADRVHDRIDLGGLLRAGGLGGRLVQVFLHAVVLLPALQRELEVDRLPLRVAVLRQPLEVRRQNLGEPSHVVAIAPPIVERHEDRLDRDGLDVLWMSGVRVGGDRDGRVELGGCHVGYWDEREMVRRGDTFCERPYPIPGGNGQY